MLPHGHETLRHPRTSVETPPFAKQASKASKADTHTHTHTCSRPLCLDMLYERSNRGEAGKDTHTHTTDLRKQKSRHKCTYSYAHAFIHVCTHACTLNMHVYRQHACKRTYTHAHIRCIRKCITHVSLCACVHMCMCACVCACACVQIFECVHSHMHAKEVCVCVCTCICMQVCMHACACVCLRTCKSLCMCPCFARYMKLIEQRCQTYVYIDTQLGATYICTALERASTKSMPVASIQVPVKSSLYPPGRL